MASVLEPKNKRGEKRISKRERRRQQVARTRAEVDRGPRVVHPDEPNADLANWAEQITMIIAVVFPFVGCIWAAYLAWTVGWMGWMYVGMVAGGWFLTSLGITVGYHRMLSHKAFEASPLARAFFTSLGAMTIEGGPITWCAVHRRHHQYSDEEGDPHSPHLHEGGVWNTIKGFMYAHTGWLFTRYWADADAERYVPDLMRDPICVNIQKHYYAFVLLSLLIPTAIGGLVTMSWQGALLGFIWGGLVRTFVGHHITWSVNSICHVFGTRDFDTTDHSTNNALFAMLAGGEGWHNNHHAFPTSARFGLKWYQLDIGWLVISALKKMGLATNLRVPTAEQIAKAEAKVAA